MPLLANVELFKNLEGKVPEVYIIGDCQDPQVIIDAVAAGYQVANAL